MSVALQTVIPGPDLLGDFNSLLHENSQTCAQPKKCRQSDRFVAFAEEGTERSKRLLQDLGGGVGVFRKTFGLGLPLPRFQARKKPNLLRECETASLIFSAVWRLRPGGKAA